MWLITTCGFFSAVQKKGEDGITVRSRSADDLDRLRTTFIPELSETVEGGGTDYPFRARVSHKAFAEGVARMGLAIDYDNFKDAVGKRLGKKRAKVCGEVWSVLQQIEPADVQKPSVSVKSGSIAYGGVIINEEGKVLLREPSNHFDGYVWTFPKGKPNKGETPEQTALREVKEETGIIARIVGRVPGEFKGGTGATVYFLMQSVRDTGRFESETSSLAWVDQLEATRLINMTTNRIGRERDLQVLTTAYAILQPCDRRREHVIKAEGGYLVRSLVCLSAFRTQYGVWPTKLRLCRSAHELLLNHHLTALGYSLLSEKIQLVVSAREDGPLVAEDNAGNCLDYGLHAGEGRLVPLTEAWLWDIAG